MIIKKGSVLRITHCRKGQFNAVATREFDSEKEEFFPVVLARGETVEGASNIWVEGESISCRGAFCKIESVIEVDK